MVAEYLSYEAIAIIMFAGMMLMLLTGQRVFGAIGFISTVKQGFIPFINDYTEYLYKMIGKYGYNKSIGQQFGLWVFASSPFSRLGFVVLGEA